LELATLTIGNDFAPLTLIRLQLLVAEQISPAEENAHAGGFGMSQRKRESGASTGTSNDNFEAKVCSLKPGFQIAA
jgi:hypothetical protein